MDGHAGDFQNFGDTLLLTHLVSGGNCHGTDWGCKGMQKGGPLSRKGHSYLRFLRELHDVCNQSIETLLVHLTAIHCQQDESQ